MNLRPTQPVPSDTMPRQRAEHASGIEPATLCPASAAAVDGLMENGLSAEALGGALAGGTSAEGSSGRTTPAPSEVEAGAQGLAEGGAQGAHTLVAAKLLRSLACPKVWCCREQMTARTLALVGNARAVQETHAQRLHEVANKSLVGTLRTPGEPWTEDGPWHAAGVIDLCDDDADALESLVQCGWDSQRVPSGVRVRAARIATLLGGLDAHRSAAAQQSDTSDALDGRDALDFTRHAALANQQAVMISATLARVRAAGPIPESAGPRVHERTGDRSVERLGRLPRGLRVADLAAVAALLVVGVAVLWPTVSAGRQRSMQVAGAGRFSGLGQAIDQYAGDFRGSLPVATASLAGTQWWNVGTPAQSNSANLFTLRRTGYSTLEQLSSPGNALARGMQIAADAWDWPSFEAVSYSYQNQFAAERACMNTRSARFVVLADRSPVVARALRGERVVYFNENSQNFAGRGQNMLRSDASVQWMTTPFTETGDNIWLPRKVEALLHCAERLARGERHCEPLRGVESPDKNDAFLCP